MNFSKNCKFSKLLSLILALVMVSTLFAGCGKDEPSAETTEPKLSLDLNETDAPTETQTEPVETTAPEVNENTATVTSQINIRSSPSTEATVIGTLLAGDKVEISRREEVTGIDWAYIITPKSGWVVMEFIEMDIPTAEEPAEDLTTPAGQGNPAPTQPATEPSGSSVQGVVNANALRIRSEPSTTGAVQGSYSKGDVVTILEAKNGWGRTNKGWIKMDYVTVGTSNTNNNNTDNTTNNNNNGGNVTGNGSTNVVFKGIVKVNELNIRSEASTSGDLVGSLGYGARVEAYEKSGNWGRTSKGWVCLDYVYEDCTTGTKTGTGKVTGTQLNIRSGPGTGYGSVGSYNQGDTVSILEQFTYNGVTWGCTNKGWISLQYVDMGTGNTGTDNAGTTTTTNKTGTVTGNGLNIRSGPGTGYNSVGSLNSGDRVTITQTTEVDGVTWGKIAQGWISLAYVDLD